MSAEGNGSHNPQEAAAGPGPAGDGCHCRFQLAPPRHFLYPAVLLLLAEEPRHGYRLVDALLHMGFGPVDRPTVYRTLADLERDGLVESWSAASSAGSSRHVYAINDAGAERLAEWMEIIRQERRNLGGVLARYRRASARVNNRC